MTPEKIVGYAVGGYFLVGFIVAMLADIKNVYVDSEHDPEISESFKELHMTFTETRIAVACFLIIFWPMGIFWTLTRD
jgi:hypothetical protein